jgi:hypothetical protein
VDREDAARPLVSSDPMPARAGRFPQWWADAGAAFLFVAGALWVTARGWLHLHDKTLGTQPIDQVFNEWMLAHDAYAVRHLANPFFTTLLNAPDGVNLMGNVAMQLPGFLLSPVTLLGGARLSYLLLITFNLAATGFAWYYVLSRHFDTSRLAALVGGAFCGFAPGMIAQSSGHPQITAQFLVPFIVWRVCRLREPGRAVRHGLALGGLIIAQLFIGEEVLFLTAVACAIATLTYVVSRPRQAGREAVPVLTGLAVATGLVLVITAYPLWVQFFGPQHYDGFRVTAKFPADLAAYPAFGQAALAGTAESAGRIEPNSTEQSAFFGWPLLILALVVVIWLRRHLVARTAAVTAVVACLLSLGPAIVYRGRKTDFPGPYALLDGLPVFDTLVVGRLALVTTTALGVLLALAADRALTLPATGRAVALLAALAALIPIAPQPLPAVGRPEIPRFVTSGEWRNHVATHRTLVPVPVGARIGMRWQIAADLGFATPQGYFFGPAGPDDNTGQLGAPMRPTWLLLQQVAEGKAVTITERERAQARADMTFWKADAVVLYDAAGPPALRQALDDLFGRGVPVDDVHVYR